MNHDSPLSMSRGLHKSVVWAGFALTLLIVALVLLKTVLPRGAFTVGALLTMIHACLDVLAALMSFKLARNSITRLNVFVFLAWAFLFSLVGDLGFAALAFSYRVPDYQANLHAFLVQLPYITFVLLATFALMVRTRTSQKKIVFHAGLLLSLIVAAVLIRYLVPSLAVAKFPPQFNLIHVLEFLSGGLLIGYGIVNLVTNRENSFRLVAVGLLLLGVAGLYFQLRALFEVMSPVSAGFESLWTIGRLIVLWGLSIMEQINWVRPTQSRQGFIKFDFKRA
jgi:hypothetical protein